VDEDPTVADPSPIEETQPLEIDGAPSPLAAPIVADPKTTATSRRALVGLAAAALALGAIIGAVVGLIGHDETTTSPRPMTSDATVTTPMRVPIAVVMPTTNRDDDEGQHDDGDEGRHDDGEGSHDD
jgi:hypothetical protein